VPPPGSWPFIARFSRLNYSRRCAEAPSAVQAHMKLGFPLAPGMEIAYVVKDAIKWEVDPERSALCSMLPIMESCLRRLGWRLRFFFTQILKK
jgi:hypothetical protein